MLADSPHDFTNPAVVGFGKRVMVNVRMIAQAVARFDNSQAEFHRVTIARELSNAQISENRLATFVSFDELWPHQRKANAIKNREQCAGHVVRRENAELRKFFLTNTRQSELHCRLDDRGLVSIGEIGGGRPFRVCEQARGCHDHEQDSLEEIVRHNYVLCPKVGHKNRHWGLIPRALAEKQENLHVIYWTLDSPSTAI